MFLPQNLGDRGKHLDVRDMSVLIVAKVQTHQTIHIK